jgi:hypothetical protein
MRAGAHRDVAVSAASRKRRRWLTKTTVLAVSLWLLAAGAAGLGVSGAAAITPLPVAANSSDQAALAAAYASFKAMPRQDVGALRPGSFHTAFDGASGKYWGTASFFPSTRANEQVASEFQDGGGIGIFTSSNGTAWRMTRVGGEPFPCPGEIPANIETAWGLKNSPYCSAGGGARLAPMMASQASSPSPVAQIATSQVGVSDTPASTNWSLDCDPYTTMVGAGASSAGCGISPTFGVRDSNELWCADFAKWVWEEAGVSSDLGTLNPGANSFYTWGQEQGETLIPDGNNPAVGDAVVFYPPGELTSSGLGYADHVAIVVGVNSDGTVDLVNGDFMGATNISVQQYNEVSIASWASSIWNPDEQWVYISPGSGKGGTGVESGPPAVLVNSPSLMNVFYQRSAGHIDNEFWTPKSGWIDQTLPGGGAAGAPAAVANSSTWMNVWYTSVGNRVENDFWRPGTGWVNQTLPGGNAVGNVAAIANSALWMNVFYMTPEGQIENDYWQPGSGWINQTLPGGNAASAPIAVVNSASLMNVWYTTVYGQIVNDYWTPAAGWRVQILPGGGATDAPTAVVNTSWWMNVWYTNIYGEIANDYWTSSAGWKTQVLPGNADATGGPSAVANSTSWMNVWYMTVNGQINNLYWTPDTGWATETLPGGGATASPTGVVNASWWMNVFYPTLNGQIANDYWVSTDGWRDQTLPA